MISVALIGADGAGKTTIARKLQDGFEKPIKYLYMGVSMSSSNAALPTSRFAYWLKRKISKKKGVKMQEGPPVNADGTIKRKKKSGLRSLLRLAKRRRPKATSACGFMACLKRRRTARIAFGSSRTTVPS